MEKLSKESIQLLAEMLINHSVRTLDAFDDLAEDATKEDQGSLLAAIAVNGVIELVSVLVGCGITGDTNSANAGNTPTA